MSGFGGGAWGASPFGGLANGLGIAGAVALSTHEVCVTLTKPPQDVSPFAPGDASAPASWLVSVPSTSRTLEVVSVTPLERPLRWTLRLALALPDSLTTVRVAAPGLLDAAGGALVGQPSADFLGLTELATSTPQLLVNTRLRAGADLANAPTPVASATSLGGTLVIRGGDYATVTGVELTRKMLVRRLVATPGDFFHLPNFGVGLAVKQPLPGSGISRLQKRVQDQVLLEPDVASASVSVSQSDSSLVVSVSAKQQATGQDVSVALNTPIGQG